MPTATGVDRLPVEVLRSILHAEGVGAAVLLPIDEGSDFITAYANVAFQSLKPHVKMLGRTTLVLERDLESATGGTASRGC